MPKTKTVEPKKTKKVVVASDSDDDSEEVEAPSVAKRTRAMSNASAKSDKSGASAKAAKAKKAVKKTIVEDSEESEDDDAPAKKEESSAEEGPKDAAAADGDDGETHAELFVKSLSFDTDEASLNNHFSQFGEIIKVKLIMRDGRSKGIGFVEFAKRADAKKAIAESNGFELDNRQITVEFSGQKPAQDRSAGGASGECDTVFCGNLGFNTSEDAIWELFGTAGKVKNVRIAHGEDGRPRGFCHVEFESPESAKKAMEMQGTMLDGRSVRLDLS